MIFNIKESDIYKKTCSNRGISTSLKAWGLLHESSATTGESLYYKNIKTKNIDIDIVAGTIDDIIWHTLPLQNCTLEKDNKIYNSFYKDIDKSINLIDKYFNKEFKYLFDFLMTIFIVSPKEKFQNKIITSITIPDMPFSAFISENSRFHLAPDIIKKNHEETFIAENIFHEMTHNQVNIEILESNILSSHFDSSSSEKIYIEWRKKNSSEESKFWPLDRVMHALHVYANLYIFRKTMINNHNSGYTEEHINNARDHAIFLYQKIIENNKFFTEEGICYAKYAYNKVVK